MKNIYLLKKCQIIVTELQLSAILAENKTEADLTQNYFRIHLTAHANGKLKYINEE